MKKEFFLEEWKNINFRLQIFRFTTIALALAILCLSFIIYKITERERIVIVPAHLKEKVVIDNRSANESYVRAMSYYITDLVYNVTPYNMKKKFEEFLQYVPSSSLKEIEEELNKRIENFGKMKISSTLVIEKIFNESGNNVYMSGKNVRYASGQILNNEPIYIHLKYNLVYGGFEIESFENITSKDFRAIERAHKSDA